MPPSATSPRPKGLPPALTTASRSGSSSTAAGKNKSEQGVSGREQKSATTQKRKASPEQETLPAKKHIPATKTSPPHPEQSAPQFDHSRDEERYGVVQRAFYPAEMTNERAAQYASGELPRPMDVLEQTLRETAAKRDTIKPGGAVVHWFKRDLRMHDNRALALAADLAKTHGVPLVCLFIVSPQDYQAHLTSAARVDFELRTLAILKQDLTALDIPLHVETVQVRKNGPNRILELCAEWKAKHVFCNIEYEVDELRRETALTTSCLEKGISFTAVHDDVIVPPGALHTGQGKQYSVYSPWRRAWVAHLTTNPGLLDAFPPPERNPSSARQRFAPIFEAPIPAAPENKTLDAESRERLRSLWPAGEHEANERLDRFLKERVKSYGDARNYPAAGATAVVSVHFSSGTLAARTAIREARDRNSTKKLDAGIEGIQKWIAEVAWRDFYKHVLSHWPYVCMHKPFKYEYTDIEWEYNLDHFDKWCKGETGFPFIDAAMRQLNNMAYMHNRCRMAVASFFAKDLLLDWRMGERYFMEQLIDGDFASNNGGWGFSASTGVDPQPYFRIFNPLLQSEKYDERGEYIRKWVPELAGIEGKAIHDPYGRGAAKQAEKAGYPRPMVVHKECRDRALARYKKGLGRDTA